MMLLLLSKVRSENVNGIYNREDSAAVTRGKHLREIANAT